MREIAEKHSFKEISEKLKTLLKLDETPIAVSFLQKPPEGVPRLKKPLYACAIWGEAKTKALYAIAEDHYPCPTGALILGFKLHREQYELLTATLTTFEELGFKFSMPPSIQTGTVGVILYAPLDTTPCESDVVLLICNPAQAMALADAIGCETGGMTYALSNTAACVVIAATYVSGKPAFSLACLGSRSFVPMKPHEMLFAIPGKKLDDVARKLEHVVKAWQSLDEMMKKMPGYKRLFQIS